MTEDPNISQTSASPDATNASANNPVPPNTPEHRASDTPGAEAPQSAPRKPIPVAVEASGTQQTLEKLLKMAQQTWAKVQPILKKQGTQALLAANRFTEHFLDETWPKLSAQAITAIPDTAKAKVSEQQAQLQPTLTKLKPVWDKGIVPAWKKGVVPLWNQGLRLLRQRLPEQLASLTNRFLTLLILTSFLVIYWIFSSLTAAPPAAAKQPPVTTKPILTRPVPSPVAQRPRMTPSSPVSTPKPLSPSVSPPSALRPSPKVDLAPPAPKPVPVAPKLAPEPTKPAALDLADLQAQLNLAIAEVGDNLITTVNAPLGHQSLTLTLGETWNTLSPATQTATAQTLWQRAQALQFERLELRDSDNQLLARSPVVGKTIIVLKSASHGTP